MKPLVPINGNGHRPAVGAAGPERLTKVDRPAFRPGPRDWQYLRAYAEALSPSGDGRVDGVAIGKHIGVTKQAVWKMLRKPGFSEWVQRELCGDAVRKLDAADLRAVNLALRGSIDHYREINKRYGRYPATGIGEGGAGGPVLENNGLIVVVHE